MTDLAIDQFEELITPELTDVIPIVNSATTKNITVANFLSGGRVIDNISCPVTDYNLGQTEYTTILYSNILLNISDYPVGTSGILKVCWANHQPLISDVITSGINFIQLYNSTDSSVVSNSEVTGSVWGAGDGFFLEQSSLFALPAGLKDYVIQGKYTSIYGPGSMWISKIELQLQA